MPPEKSSDFSEGVTSYDNDDFTKEKQEDGSSNSGSDVTDFPSTPSAIKKEKRRIMKNIILISVAFMLNFTAYNGLARLQSSLHRDEGMGTTTQAILYAALMISCLFIPKLLISAVGHKWTIPISFSGYILWMAANGYAVWATMVPTSILVGLCAAPLWTAQCAYFTKIAGRYAKLTGESEEAVVTRFFGIFFMFFQCSGIFGSIISSTVLQPTGGENETLSEEEVTMYCGLNDCPDNNVTNPNADSPDETTVWTMVGIYIGLGVMAVILVCVAVDKLPKSMREDRSKAKQEAKKSVVHTATHLRHLAQCLLIPITMYSGFEQAFYNAEWNNSFITCSLGIWTIGWVTLPFGVVNAIVSFTGGTIAKYTGRMPIFTLGMLVDLSIHLTLILWDIQVSKEYVFYMISGLWGFTDGIWQTQINALYGSIFSEESEAAFSNYRMWESLGFIIAFAYSSALCTSTKLYIVMSVLFLGMLLYYVVEIRHKRKKNETDDNVAGRRSAKQSDLQHMSKNELDVVTFRKTSDISVPEVNSQGGAHQNSAYENIREF